MYGKMASHTARAFTVAATLFFVYLLSYPDSQSLVALRPSPETRQLFEEYAVSRDNPQKQNQTSQQRAGRVKKGRTNNKAAHKIPRASCGCMNNTAACHAQRLNETVRNYCLLNPRRFDCLDLVKAECKNYADSCGLVARTPAVRKGIFDKIDCNDLTGNCVKDRDVLCQNQPWIAGCNDFLSNDIMVAVMLVDKFGYTQFTASVIKNIHRIDSKNIFIFTNGLGRFKKSILRQWYGNDIIVISQEVKPSQSIFSLPLKQFLKSSHKILILLDSETVILPQYQDFISSSLDVKKSDIVSLYHSSAMQDFKRDCPKSIKEGLCRGLTVDDIGIALTRSFANVALHYNRSHIPDSASINWEEIRRSEGIIGKYPSKSLTMRIGQSQQDKFYCGLNDVPYRFNRCAFPSWVKDGIEFYFDRCTNPEEEFIPGYSIPKIDEERRLWVRPAISYTLYGSEPRYNDVALRNAVRIFTVYPGWKMWIYIENTVPKTVIEKLCEYDIHMVDMSQSEITCGRAWRFLIASEPVKRFVVRDIDSLLIARGKAAVDEWIQSGRKFHVMRDHVKHSGITMNAGMWGGTGDAYPGMRELIECMTLDKSKYQDTRILVRWVWKVAKDSVWAHDSHPLQDFGEYHPFPVERLRKGDVVGRVVPYKRKKQ